MSGVVVLEKDENEFYEIINNAITQVRKDEITEVVVKEKVDELPSVVLASESGSSRNPQVNSCQLIKDVHDSLNSIKHCNSRPLFCTSTSDCEFQTLSQIELTRHMECHHLYNSTDYCNARTLLCTLKSDCEFQTLSQSELVKHMEGHQLYCNKCSFQTVETKLLKKHEKKVHSICSCSKCPFRAPDRTRLKQHRLSVHTRASLRKIKSVKM